MTKKIILIKPKPKKIKEYINKLDKIFGFESCCFFKKTPTLPELVGSCCCDNCYLNDECNLLRSTFELMKKRFNEYGKRT